MLLGWLFVVAACVGLALALPRQRGFAVGFGVGACAMAMILLDSPPWHIERWRQGAEGEKRTAKALRSLTRRGDWTLVNDVETPRGNIDHILVGPAGVFVLETKNLSGIVSVERGVLKVRWREDPDDGYEDAQVARRARALAARLSECLGAAGMSKVWVQPVVVMWSDFAQGSIQSEGVAWVAGGRLARVLRARPEALATENVAEVVNALGSLLRRSE